MRLSFRCLVAAAAVAVAAVAACRSTAEPAKAEPLDASNAPISSPPLPDAGERDEGERDEGERDAGATDAGATDADTADARSEDAGAATSLELRKMKSDIGECLVFDKDAKKTRGRATARGTAAGGSDVECIGFAAEGKVILFENSRGRYAKDARPGKTNDRSIPCAHGVFANDLSSCVELDFTPFAIGTDDLPFEIQYCKPGPDEWTCTPLVSIPHGMKRLGDTAPTMKPRWWDARYCSNNRLLVAANDELRLYETPSGRRLSSVAATEASLVRCDAEKAETTNGKNIRHTWNLLHDKIAE